MLLALYSGNTWEVSNLQTVIYILTAYLVSGSLDFGILLFKTGEKASQVQKRIHYVQYLRMIPAHV